MKQTSVGTDSFVANATASTDATHATVTAPIAAGSHMGQAIISANAGTISFTDELYSYANGGGTTGSSISVSASSIGLESVGLYYP